MFSVMKNAQFETRRGTLAAVSPALLSLPLATLPSFAQAPSAKPAAKSSKPATSDLPLIDLAGYQHALAKYHGKPLLVTFWATWCEPCRDEFPMLVELYKQ